LIGGCRLNECNYATQGNYDALGNVYLCKKIMQQIGLDPERLRIALVSSGDGILFAEVVTDFVETIRALGPIGSAEVLDRNELKFRLEAVKKLVPYIKLVERQRLRVPFKSEAAYDQFFTSDAFHDLFNDLIADPLAISRILSVLQEKPLSIGEISGRLQLDPAEVSKHMNRSSRQGFVRYDLDGKRYALARGEG